MTFAGSTPSRAVATATDVLGPWFRALARSVQTGVVLVDPDGAPIYCNDAARELLALPERESSEELLADLARRIPHELRTSCGSSSELVEVDVAPPSGRRRVLLRSVPLEGEDCGSVVLVEDRTKLAALEASLVLASRVRSESVLRSHVHDLKAPLHALSINLELLRKSLEEEAAKPADVRERQLAATDDLGREIRRLGRSLDLFLRHATRPDRSKRGPRRLEVRRPVRETARLVRETARAAGVRLRTFLPATSTYVHADADLLKQALLNLVLNALEAQADGGEIRLRVVPEEQRVRVAVEDDGPGIPEEVRDRVFEMNFTTKEDGTGIGLTVARSLVEGQGGSLSLESRPGEGTTVAMHLPLGDG